MTAIAFEIPEEIRSIADAVEGFARAEVIARHEAHADVLEDPRALYGVDGRLSEAALRHRREVRMASARAGFYTMSVPRSLGGAGLGLLAYYVVLERLYRLCGPTRWLCDYVVSHWAFGPSPVLSQVTPEARERILPGLLDGSQSR